MSPKNLLTVRRLLSREPGQAVVEMALAMVPFLLLFLLMVDGGLYFIEYVSNVNAVREGARCGVVGGSDAAIIDRVGSPTGATGPATVLREDSDDPGTDIDAGDRITVSITWNYDWIAPIELLGLSGTTTRTASEKMRLETDTFDKTCP